MSKLIIFIHGIGSDKNVWKEHINALENDTEITIEEYKNNITNIKNNHNYYLLYEYESKIFKIPFIGNKINRIKKDYFGKKDSGQIKIDSHAKILKTKIENLEEFREIDLVTHSMGGIITIFSLYELIKNKTHQKIKNIIFYGTPLEGANERNKIQEAFGNYIATDILDELKPSSNTIGKLQQIIKTEKLNSLFNFLYINGNIDNRIVTVDEKSFKSKLGKYENIDGDHSSIVKPTNFNSDSFILFKKIIFNSSKKNSEILYTLDDYLKKLSYIINNSKYEVLFTSTKMSSTDDVDYGRLQQEIINSSENFKNKNTQRSHYGIIDSSDETKKGAIELRLTVDDIILKFNKELNWLGFNFLISDNQYVIIRLKKSNGHDKYSIFIDNKDLAKKFKQIFLELWHDSLSMSEHIGNIYNQDTLKTITPLQITNEKLKNLFEKILEIDNTHYAIPYRVSNNTIDKYFNNCGISKYSLGKYFNKIFTLYSKFNYIVNKESLHLLRRLIIENKSINYDIYSENFFFMYFLANYLKTMHSLEDIKSHLNINKSFNILDIGGGGGASIIAILDFMEYNKIEYNLVDIIDNSEKQINISKELTKNIKNINYHNDDITTTINTLEKYDLIVASNIFCELNHNNIDNITARVKDKLSEDGLLLVIERTESGVYDSLFETDLTQIKYIYQDCRFKFSDEANAKVEELLDNKSLIQYKDYIKMGYTLRYGLYK